MSSASFIFLLFFLFVYLFICFFFFKLLEVLENNKGKVNRIHPLSGVWNHINVFVNTVFADQQGRKQPSFFSEFVSRFGHFTLLHVLANKATVRQ